MNSHLRAMPLHAITEIHGEEGLRRRLTLELRRLPDADRVLVESAAAWAAALHADQRRTREPYVNHVLRVTLRILCYYRISDPEVLAAALLHDAVEDQSWAMTGQAEYGPPPQEQAFDVLAARYGRRVGRLVRAVSHPADQHYVDHLATALAEEPWARVLKLSDFTDNGVGIIHAVGPKVVRSARKYTPAVPVLRDLLGRPDTPLEPAVKAHVGAQLDLAERRFAAILAV